jgi:hypothetical protein
MRKLNGSVGVDLVTETSAAKLELVMGKEQAECGQFVSK